MRGDPGVDALTVGVAHQARPRRRARLLDERLPGPRPRWGTTGRRRRRPGRRRRGAAVELLDGRGRAGSAPCGRSPRTSASRAPISPSSSIRSSLAVARRRRGRAAGARRAAYAVHDLEQRLEAGLVVGQVDDDGDVADGEEVHPAGVVLGVGAERAQALDHRRRGSGRPPAPADGRGQGVLDVEAGQPGQRHRYVDELDQRVGVAVRGRAPRPSRRSPWWPGRRCVEHLADAPASRGRGRTPTAAP